MFAIWGMAQLLMAIVYLAIVVKYTALLPFGCVLFALEYAMRLALQVLARSGLISKGPIITKKKAPGGLADWVFAPLGVLLFWMSIPATSQ